MTSERHYLTPLFAPQSVAIIGASERSGSIGATLVRNMLEMQFPGRLFLVNPAHETIFGQRCHPSVESIPLRLDLAVICTRAETVPAIVDACGRAGTRAAIVISGGFSETGAAGATLERAMLENARRHHLRLMGPNCLGIMRPHDRVNLTFAHGSALPGTIGLISQSGALCTAILDWARPNKVGFSTVASLGDSGDIDFGEVLDYFASDSKTENIFLYIEGIKDARRFMSALRAAARVKPVLLIKVGRHAAGEKAARSHTGALVGADDVFDASLRRAGVVRLDTIDQMYAAARGLFSHFRPRGNRLAIITNGGGPGALAADHAEDKRIPLAQLSPETLARLDKVLPPNWSKSNPIDIIGDADVARYTASLAACLDDKEVDGVLAILTPQAMTDPTAVARSVIAQAAKSEKPLVTCWMGEEQVRKARQLFKRALISNFDTPEPAVDLFSQVSAYYRNQQLLLQAPPSLTGQDAPDVESARLVIESGLAEGRTILNEMESKALLAAFRIPIARVATARSATEAMALAEQTGLPVAMKVVSPQVSHKTDSGGVRLNIANLAAVRRAYQEIVDEVRANRPDAEVLGVAIEPMIQKPHGRELLIGVISDRIFGPAILLSAGGIGVDVRGRERTVALPPLNSFLVADMLSSLHEAAHLGKFRNMPPVNLPAVEAILLRVSEMVCELPWIREMDINPLIVDESGAIAVDARVVIGRLPPKAGRYDHMAIHPYPSNLVSHHEVKGGKQVTVRPIRPEDAEIEHAFVKNLSPEARYYRFMHTLRELSLPQLIRFTQIDYDREMAFVAIVEREGREEEIGVARYTTNPDGEGCEFAIVVADEWKGGGVAGALMHALIESARRRGLRTMGSAILAENKRMLKFVTGLGFKVSTHPYDKSLKQAELDLA